MASEKLGMVPPQQMHNGLNQHPQLVFSEAFACGPQPPRRHPTATGDPCTKAATRELTASFRDHHHYFQSQLQPQQLPPPPQAAQFRHQWSANSRSSGGEASEDDDGEDNNDDDDDDDDEEEEEEELENNLENIVTVAKISDGIKEGNMAQSGNDSNNGNNSSGEVRNASSSELYYTQYLNGAEGPSSSSRQKDNLVMENGCGFSGRKEGSYLCDSGESLRAILSDPITGMLMEDAMILPCGHSFGSSGIQKLLECHFHLAFLCVALRLAIHAFRREEELQVNHSSKRRRERYDRDKSTFGDPMLLDHPRGRGVQFPFSVTDRVIIKGNKRTPQRFVGREAIVTTQCLNGWYVVKTLDNAESVKLQYRSLAKVTDNPPTKQSPVKMTPNWL
ncbi:UNVERIFIED_CONTAM: U-box domain-containing protein 62 [Sesamum angustifolium]|uniref:U-box domain-containing protein 62 n=1 Tax=Sesamum angustifolium TaxID=2727405 RepID=A0AAW2PV42_9LAMI